METERKTFQEDFYFHSQYGKYLYQTYAKELPIIDYHCHLLPREIYENKVFDSLGEIWLAHDHYKWRAMRTFGIEERYITGDASWREKFRKFAEILPYLVGNPLYIWCALELKRYFGIEEPLCGENADAIYDKTQEIIRKEQITPRYCMEKFKVESVCTTDDPVDSLEYHQKMAEIPGTRILPAFRPDKAFYCEKTGFPEYVSKLEKASGISIASFEELLSALENRLVYFRKFGARVSDNGIENFTYISMKPEQLDEIFRKALAGKHLEENEVQGYRTGMLLGLAALYHKHDYVMQLHVGTYQGANKVGEKEIGAACGFDCIDDITSIHSVGALLNEENQRGILPKTILYPLDASCMENYAVLAAGFCGGSVRGKVQLGAPWWFHDHIYGIRRQMEAAGNLYPISLWLGMLTDSRSFLSYPRHEIYRRVLCDYLGELCDRKECLEGEEVLKEIIQKVCLKNTKEFFGFQ